MITCPAQSQLFGAFFFSPQIYTRYGKCYTFNSGLDGNPLLTTLKGGTGNGLEIMLDIQQDEYLPVWGETGQCSSYHHSHIFPYITFVWKFGLVTLEIPTIPLVLCNLYSM